MGAFSTAEKNKMLDAWAGRADYTQSADVYVKLHTGDPGAAGTSNPATETDRVAVTFGAAASGGSISNTADIIWTNVAADETVSWVSFWDASSGGNYLGKDQLTDPKDLNTGDTATISSGALTMSITDPA